MKGHKPLSKNLSLHLISIRDLNYSDPDCNMSSSHFHTVMESFEQTGLTLSLGKLGESDLVLRKPSQFDTRLWCVLCKHQTGVYTDRASGAPLVCLSIPSDESIFLSSLPLSAPPVSSFSPSRNQIQGLMGVCPSSALLLNPMPSPGPFSCPECR